MKPKVSAKPFQGAGNTLGSIAPQVNGATLCQSYIQTALHRVSHIHTDCVTPCLSFIRHIDGVTPCQSYIQMVLHRVCHTYVIQTVLHRVSHTYRRCYYTFYASVGSLGETVLRGISHTNCARMRQVVHAVLHRVSCQANGDTPHVWSVAASYQ